METNYNILSYIIYLAVSFYITVWVGLILYKNGRYYMMEMFDKNEALVNAVNKLLLMGYYLINLGYATVVIRYWTHINSFRGLIETTTFKLGIIIVTLAIMHYINMVTLSWYHKKFTNNMSNLNN